MLRNTKLVALIALVALTACSDSKTEQKAESKDKALNNAKVAEPAEKAAPAATKTGGMTEEEKTSYAIGANSGGYIARTMQRYASAQFTIDTELAAKGFADALAGNSQLDDGEVREILTSFTQKMEKIRKEKEKEVSEKNKKLGTEFLAKNKAEKDVVTLESGLQYKVLVAGEGKKPVATDTVKVHYKGSLIDGSEFDSSYKRKKPAEFPVTGVIKGWVEALQLMPVGSKWQLFIPPELAYGSTSRPSIPGNSVLIFEVELLDIVNKDEQDKAKEDEGHEGHGHE